MTKQLKNANTSQNIYPELEDGQVTTSKISDGAVTKDKIRDYAITEDKLEDYAVSTDKIEDYAVTTDKIASGAINGYKLLSNAVSTDKIDNGAVTIAKVSDEIANVLNRKLYSHHVNIRVTINNIGYHFYMNIISTKNDSYNYDSLWNYMYVQGNEMVYALMVEGEGYLVAWDEDISVSISSKQGDKLNPAINIDLSNADSYEIYDKIIEIY